MRTAPLIALALPLLAGPAFAQDSVANGSAAGSAASQVATHLAASGVQTALAASVIPAGVAGTISVAGGGAVAGSGVDVSRAAGASATAASGPLKVDDRVVIAADPAPQVPYDVQKPHAQ